MPDIICTLFNRIGIATLFAFVAYKLNASPCRELTDKTGIAIALNPLVVRTNALFRFRIAFKLTIIADMFLAQCLAIAENTILRTACFDRFYTIFTSDSITIAANVCCTELFVDAVVTDALLLATTVRRCR